MPLMCCGDVGLWEMLGVLPASATAASTEADASFVAATSFADVSNHHDDSMSFANNSVATHSGQAPPADISGMINGLMAMQAAQKAGVAYNWNSQEVMDEATTAADKLDQEYAGGLGNPTNFSDLALHHLHESPSHQPTSFAASSSTDPPETNSHFNVDERIGGAENDVGGYALQVKHIPIPKSFAPQPAVPLDRGGAQLDDPHSSNFPPVDWGPAGKEWTMASHHSRMLANQMNGSEGIKARALQERLDTIQNNQMRDALDLVRNMDSWMKAKNPYIEKVQELTNLNWTKQG